MHNLALIFLNIQGLFKVLILIKWYYLGARLPLINNRKSYTLCQLQPLMMSLCDLWRSSRR